MIVYSTEFRVDLGWAMVVDKWVIVPALSLMIHALVLMFLDTFLVSPICYHVLRLPTSAKSFCRHHGPITLFSFYSTTLHDLCQAVF